MANKGARKAGKTRKAPPAKRRRPAAGSAREAGANRRQRRRRGRRTLHHILVLLFLLAGGAALSLTVFFKIESVDVTGADRYDPAELVAFTGVQIGDNLLRVKTGEIEQRLLEAYPYIESVAVRRALPPSIRVEIVQSVPVGAIENGDEYILITRDGKLLERGFLLLTQDIMLIRGADVGDREPGERMGTWEYEQKPSRGETDEERAARLERNAEREAHATQETEALVMLDYLWKAIDATGFENITNVDLTDRLNMKIVYENRMTLLLGSEADLEDKLLFIQVALDRLHPEAHGTLNVADVRSDRLFYTPAAGYRREDGSPVSESTSDGEHNADSAVAVQ